MKIVRIASALLSDDHIEHAPRFVKYCEANNLRGKACFLGTLKSGAFGGGRQGGARAGGGGGRGQQMAAVRTPERVTAEGDLGDVHLQAPRA